MVILRKITETGNKIIPINSNFGQHNFLFNRLIKIPNSHAFMLYIINLNVRKLHISDT